MNQIIMMVSFMNQHQNLPKPARSLVSYLLQGHATLNNWHTYTSTLSFYGENHTQIRATVRTKVSA